MTHTAGARPFAHSTHAAPLLLRRGRVIDPESGRDLVADVAIKDGLIAEIGVGLTTLPAARVIDCEGMIVSPGLVDPHVHLREPGQEHKETIATGSAAGVAGGFTTLCCMPNTSPAIDSPEIVGFVLHRARETALCRVFPTAAATKGRKGEEVTEISLLAKAGAVGFTDDGDCIASAGMQAKVFGLVRETGRAFMQHAQDPTMTRGAAMHAGAISTKLGLGGWPRAAEEIIVERDIRLTRDAQCRYHVQHISSGGTVELIRRARVAKLPVSGEASPHHLLLTHDACATYSTNAKMNPPLRETADVKALREGVADGTITVLATDHAPHAPDEKALPFEEAPFGIIGLETALALYIEALVTPGLIDWPRLIALMTIEPARLCNLDVCGIGTLKVGGPADVTVINPTLAWTIARTDLAGKCANTPFLGRNVKGRSVFTIVAGRIQNERARS